MYILCHHSFYVNRCFIMCGEFGFDFSLITLKQYESVSFYIDEINRNSGFLCRITIFMHLCSILHFQTVLQIFITHTFQQPCEYVNSIDLKCK